MTLDTVSTSSSLPLKDEVVRTCREGIGAGE